MKRGLKICSLLLLTSRRYHRMDLQTVPFVGKTLFVCAVSMSFLLSILVTTKLFVFRMCLNICSNYSSLFFFANFRFSACFFFSIYFFGFVCCFGEQKKPIRQPIKCDVKVMIIHAPIWQVKFH